MCRASAIWAVTDVIHAQMWVQVWVNGKPDDPTDILVQVDGQVTG